MKRLILLTVLLTGCGDAILDEIVTNDIPLLREFQRDCQARGNTYVRLEQVTRLDMNGNRWQMRCVQYPKSPLWEDPGAYVPPTDLKELQRKYQTGEMDDD